MASFNEENLTLNLAHISEKLDIPKPTVSRIISALLEEGFVEKVPKSTKYRLGLKCYRLGLVAKKSGIVRDVAYEHMLDLRDRFNETVNLYVRDGKYRIVYEQVECFQNLKRSIVIGERFPLYAGAAGRCFLAYMKEHEIKKVLEEMVRVTDNTIMDPEIVRSRLEAVRQNGYEVSVSEREAGISSVAAPIFMPRGQEEMVIVLSGPSFRFSDAVIGEMCEEVKRVSVIISERLGIMMRS